MKKTLKLLAFLLIMMMALTVVASASGENTTSYNYEIEDTEYTVIFSNSSMSQEKQESIARKLVGIDDSSAQTYGLKCTLFGHDYVYETAEVIIHKVNKYAPRCERHMSTQVSIANASCATAWYELGAFGRVPF